MTYIEFIKKHEREYEIFKLREQSDMTYNEIATFYKKSSSCIRSVYHDFKLKQFVLYTNYLEEITQSDWSERKQNILDFYLDYVQIVAYLEYGEYADILKAFRNGEHPTKVDCVIPYRNLDDTLKLDLQTKIRKAREVDKKTFQVIGNELELTPKKASHLYQGYYNKKVIEATKRIQPTVDFKFAEYLHKHAYRPQKKWELIKRDYRDFVQDLL